MRKKEIVVKVTTDRPPEYYFDKCTDLLLQYPMRKKDPNFVQEWIIAVGQWRMSTLGINDVEVTFRKLSGLACAYKQNVDIDIKRLKKCKKPEHFVAVTDAIIHEIEHLKISKYDSSITKDANGNQSSPYIRPHFGYITAKTLEKACQTDFFTAGDYALAMYCLNPDETLARKAGYTYSVQLYNAVRGHSAEFDQTLDTFVALEEKKFRTTPRDFVDYIDKYQTLHDIIHRDVYNYQTSYVEAGCPENEQLYFDTAREIEPNQQASHDAFRFYVSTGQYQRAIELVNNVCFQNNPAELQTALTIANQQNIGLDAFSRFSMQTIEPYQSNITKGINKVTLATSAEHTSTPSKIMPPNQSILISQQ